ncbi:MAG: hypothetical protein ACRD1X_12360 [Vicinamibacteria bacterium]
MGKQVLFYRGDKFQSGGTGKFAKDVIKDGDWFHPVTERQVLVTPERRAELLANTERYLANGNKIPYRDGHRNDAKANMGYWTGPFIAYKDTLVGVVEPTDREAMAKMRDGSIADVSVVMEKDVVDSRGVKYPGETITAIDATSFPVVTGQKRFLEFSREAQGRGEDFLIPKDLAGMSPEGDTHLSQEGTMDPKKLALALGLPEDTDAEKILSALAEREKERKDALGKVKAAEGLSTVKPEDLKAAGLELKDGKLVKLSASDDDAPLTPRERQMREQLDAVMLDRAKDKLTAAKAKADAYVKAGLVPPAIAEKLSKLFALKDKVEALALSADGKGLASSEVDVVGTLEEVLKNIRSITDLRLSRLTPADDGQPSDKTPAQLEEEGRKLAREIQGRKEKVTA